jgi:hypothetical protein
MITERRNAAWPWILVPLITLVVAWGFHSCKDAPEEIQTATVAGL